MATRPRRKSTDPAPAPAVIEGTAGADVLIGTSASETLRGLAGNDRIDGGAGDDRIEGGDGNDELVGGLGNDTILGGAGDDLIGLLGGGGGVDRIDGGDGFDSLNLDFSRAVAGVTVTNDLAGGGTSVSASDGTSAVNVERLGLIQGGAGNDDFTADNSDNRLSGGGGNDRLVALRGNDLLSGGAGDDRLDGGSGSDILDGDTGADTMTGGAGADAFRYDDASEFDGSVLDIIIDFRAAEGDQLWFFQNGADNPTVADPIGAGYLRFTQLAQGALIELDADGGGDAFMAVALLSGVDAATLTNDAFFIQL